MWDRSGTRPAPVWACNLANWPWGRINVPSGITMPWYAENTVPPRLGDRLGRVVPMRAVRGHSGRMTGTAATCSGAAAHGKRKMPSGAMMILKIARQNAAQVTIVENDNVIQAFTADRADEMLDVGILPRCSRGSVDLCDPHRPNAITECRTIRFVSVPHQIARCTVPG